MKFNKLQLRIAKLYDNGLYDDIDDTIDMHDISQSHPTFALCIAHACLDASTAAEVTGYIRVSLGRIEDLLTKLALPEDESKYIAVDKLTVMQLNYAVAVAEGLTYSYGSIMVRPWLKKGNEYGLALADYNMVTSWSFAGPLMLRNNITLSNNENNSTDPNRAWLASDGMYAEAYAHKDWPLEAIARCYLYKKANSTLISIPKELL